MTAAAPYVLVVDDDLDIREAVETVLAMHSVTVRTAGDGADALRILRAEPALPCLILLDLMMPGMNGFEFRAEQLRDPTLRAIPTVILSGGGDLEQKAAALDLPAYKKPIELGILLDLVRPHLAAARPAQPPGGRPSDF
jgi:DNA-binding response OmpR family regulator